jgi:hypothetical protein
VIPYGHIAPTIEPKLKQEDLPTWDGNPTTAIEYFWKVQQQATLGGYIPSALGYWLWLKLKEGSDVQNWFATLPFEEQSRMRGHWVDYLKGIKEGYLGRNWQFDIGEAYKAQYFRQPGHERELPKSFITRRIMYTRMLAKSDDGGPLEVHLVMARAPLAWRTILILENIQSSSMLYTKAAEHEASLLDISRNRAQTTNIITSENLVSTLRKMGYTLDRSKFNNFPQNRRANLTFNEEEESLPVEDHKESFVTHANTQEVRSNEDEILAEVFQVLKKRQRPPPPGGYMFSRNDHVTTKMGRLPPSPCKCCGSPNHWDKECPDHAVYEERSAKSGYSNEVVHKPENEYYQSAYGILLSQRVASLQVDRAKLDNQEADFKSAVCSSMSNQSCHRRKTGVPPVSMVEVEDEAWEEHRNRPKSHTHVLQSVTDWDIPSENVPESRPTPSKHPTPQQTLKQENAPDKPSPKRRVFMVETEDEDVVAARNKPTSSNHLLISVDELEDLEGGDDPVPSNKDDENSQGQEKREAYQNARQSEATNEPSFDQLPPPPLDAKPIRLRRKRQSLPGMSSFGVSVLSTKGWVAGLENSKVDLRLDSCADVTLISEDFFNTLKNTPRIQQGMQMKLWQLTDKNEELKGYVRIPIFMETADGVLLESEAEAYVVPKMTVPILLGEDYQSNYELGVTRNVETGTKIHFAGSDHVIAAVGVDRTPDFTRMRQSATLVNKFVKAKTHRREKAKRHRRKVKFGVEEMTVRAAEDYILKPHTCRRIRLEGQFDTDKDWLVQKNLLANANDSYFAVPNTLISARNPWIPIANPTDQPRHIRKGEVIGSLHDPDSFFESPGSAERADALARHATAITAIIKTQMEPQAPGESPPPIFSQPIPDEEEEYGPKTAAMPDLTDYPSARMEELIDVGTLPSHLKDQAWDMLRRRQKAFGFDGRLGHLPTKVHIRTVDGQVPIAVPMYGSSPEKRRVMDEQMDKWFEQDVIEPSISPWSAPVVIAYRNGKPRFCVDYRKLNAVTTPDEFPIPRQSEILSSLSGAQVLSSLDALSGFTQLELHEDDIEKTAFRTHRGLFQFKRMPFGLRNGPSIFQRVMQGILAPYLWLFCLVYIDDIVVFSKSYEEHITHLDKVLEAIEKSGITLSPNKCHLFYSSILLLGHKVSRLGLSTHAEKVKAIVELERPRKLSQLQAFLGMVVYFSAFIPYYAFICAPLFQLTRKDCKWKWGAEQEYAFQAAKDALRSSPVLGHPIEGLPYRLYTDASDEAAGCALQQIQPIKVKDLEGTKAYDRLRKAYDNGLPPPKLTTTLSTKNNDSPADDQWGPDFDSSTVHVERVIGYWSRTFKGAETRYSTTEREALAAH